MKTLLLFVFMTSLAGLMLAGCSGDGSTSSSTTSASALTVADKVSVVDSQTDSSSSGASLTPLTIGAPALRAVSALPSSSDYNTDPTFVYVEERSAETFNIINEILCMMAQAKYNSMLNKGNYKAQIDLGQCANSKDDASSAGQAAQNQSSGSNATEYAFWTVNSSRADNSSPHIVKVWIHEKADQFEPAKVIDVKLTITEAKSSSNPYGLFELHFKAHPPNDTSTTMFSGYLKAERDSSGTVLLKFYNNGTFDLNVGGSMSMTEQVTLDRGADGSSGSGSMHSETTDPSSGTTTADFDIAYNNSFFYRSDGTTPVCLSRTSYDATAWRYGLYYDELHSTDPGGRVTLSSGFPIKFTSGGTDYQGWVGFYGLWFPESVTLVSGDTVYKQDYSAAGTTETQYTVFISRGKLRKHTRKTLTLGEMANIPLSWSDCTEVTPGNWTCSDTRVEWNSTTEKFVKNAVRSQSTNWVWQNITAADVVLATSAWDFNFYSESLGGSGRINLMDPSTGSQVTLSNTSRVVFHIEDAVFPGETVPTTLACFENCPDPANINTSSPYFADSTWQSTSNIHQQSVAPSSATYYSYDFDTSAMELGYLGTAAVMTDSTNNQNGVWTGALFEPTAENLALLACDWDANTTCSWQAWESLSVFYTWETGTQQWNRLTALQSGSTFLSFSPPLSLEYTHSWPDSSTSKFYLEYNGFGDLNGIPGKCVDMDAGADVDCWDSTGTKFIRWVPEFSIPDGSSLTGASDGLTYYVKALEKEERMTAVATSGCTGAGLSLQTYTLPDASLFQSPVIGTEPVVEGAPAVIGGVLQ